MSTENFKGITQEESEVIAFAVRNGIRSGRLDNLEWTVSIYQGNSDNDSLLHIVQMIEEGNTTGYEPTWLLTFDRKLSV